LPLRHKKLQILSLPNLTGNKVVPIADHLATIHTQQKGIFKEKKFKDFSKTHNTTTVFTLNSNQ